MPNSDPMLTCVVLTGRLCRLEVATSATVTRLAAKPCPGFMSVQLDFGISQSEWPVATARA